MEIDQRTNVARSSLPSIGAEEPCLRKPKRRGTSTRGGKGVRPKRRKRSLDMLPDMPVDILYEVRRSPTYYRYLPYLISRVPDLRVPGPERSPSCRPNQPGVSFVLAEPSSEAALGCIPTQHPRTACVPCGLDTSSLCTSLIFALLLRGCFSCRLFRSLDFGPPQFCGNSGTRYAEFDCRVRCCKKCRENP